MLTLVVLIFFVAVVWQQWDKVEVVLTRLVARKASQELETPVSVQSFRIRSRGIVLRGLKTTGLSIGSLEVKTSGLLSLLSCFGQRKFGEFVFGFYVRDIDEILVKNLSLEEDNPLAAHEERVAAAKQLRLKKEAKYNREFKLKWRGQLEDEEDLEDLNVTQRLKKVGEALKKKTFDEKAEALKELRANYKKRDGQNKEAARLTKRNQSALASELWRIGRIQLDNLNVNYKGHEVVIDHFELRGFVGDSAKLRRKLIISIMPDIFRDTVRDKIETRKNATKAVISKHLQGAKRGILGGSTKPPPSNYSSDDAALSAADSQGDDDDDFLPPRSAAF